jgi:hypothetical protein
MKAKKKQARGLEEVSHFFLSHQSPSPIEEPSGKETQAPPCEVSSLASNAAHGFPLFFFSSSGLFAEKSFLACNLAIELAKRNFSVGLIETTTRVPNTFFLLGSLFPESAPALESLKLFDISIGSPKNIRAVFWKKNVDYRDALTTLNRLRSESEFLIINATPEILGLREMTCFMNHFFIVPFAERPEQILNSYLVLKQISRHVSCGEIGLLVMEEGFSQNTDAAFKILTDMASKFLSCKVRCAGAIPKAAEFFRSILDRVPLLLEEENSAVSRSIKTLADLIQKDHPV